MRCSASRSGPSSACSRTSPRRPAPRYRPRSATSSDCMRSGLRPVGPILGSSAARRPARGSPGPSRRCWTRRRRRASIPPVSRPAPRRRAPRAPTCARSRPSTRHMPRRATPSAMETTTWRPPEPPRRCARAPDAWSARPVLVYGFDDLTVEQLELLSALAEASEVTVSVAYEDRDAFVARAHLLPGASRARRRIRGAARAQPRQHREPDAVSARALPAARADGSDRAGRRPRADGGGRRAWSGRADRWRDRSPARRRGEARRDRGRASVARSPRPPVRERAGGLRRSRSRWRPACPPPARRSGAGWWRCCAGR